MANLNANGTKMEKISLKWLKENKPEFLKEIELHKGSIDKFAPYGKYEYGTVEYRVISCIGMCESIACYGSWNIDKYLYNSPHYGLEKYACDYLLNMVKSKIKTIQYGVATDSDGCTYNGIIWED